MTANPVVAFLILGAVVLLSNIVMFAIVRGVLRGDVRWTRNVQESLSRSLGRRNSREDELHRKVAELPGQHLATPERGPTTEDEV